MDDRRFDDFARTVASGGWSRRAALRYAAGGALGAVLTRLGVAEAEAACTPHGKPCQGDGGCCSGLCERNGRCKKNGRLTGRCRCRCPQGTTECGTKRCCGAGEDCQGGQCVPAGGACSIDDDCGGNLMCDHNQGSICRCSHGFDCGQGICWPCCTDDQCTATGFAKADGFYCDVETHSCRCGGGRSMCDVGTNGTTKWACVDLSSNATCGSSCSSYGPCTNGRECINHSCQFPA